MLWLSYSFPHWKTSCLLPTFGSHGRICSKHSCTASCVDVLIPVGPYQGHNCWATREDCVLFCEKPPNSLPKVTYCFIFSSAADVPAVSCPGQHLAAVFLISVILIDMSVEGDGIVMLICNHPTNTVLNSSQAPTACHLCLLVG